MVILRCKLALGSYVYPISVLINDTITERISSIDSTHLTTTVLVLKNQGVYLTF